MAKKIILFLSEFRQDAWEKEYVCPGDLRVTGRQTNEAPVKYLLQVHPDISEILCIVTPKALSTAWGQFSAEIQAVAPQVKIEQIPFVDGADFTAGPLADVMQRVQQGDEIYLETTGGFRNAVMHLLLLSRILTYKGIRTAGAVYSNFTEGEIQDVSHLISLFDFVGGMQELTSFGNVRTLRMYYHEREHAQEIDQLLDSVDRLWECITLCKTNQIPHRMERFNQALESAENCGDHLMHALLPAFRNKFGKKLTTPGLIKWCVQSDMLQQALTVYKERIPAYLLIERPDILHVPDGMPEPEMHKDYISKEEARFYEQFLKMGANMRKAYYGAEVDSYQGERKDYTVTTLEHLEELMPHSYFITQYPISRLRSIVMDYLYIRAIRNMTNHANDQTTGSQKQIMAYLNEHGYKRLEEVRADDIKKTLLDALEHLQPLTKREKNR